MSLFSLYTLTAKSESIFIGYKNRSFDGCKIEDSNKENIIYKKIEIKNAALYISTNQDGCS